MSAVWAPGELQNSSAASQKMRCVHRIEAWRKEWSPTACLKSVMYFLVRLQAQHHCLRQTQTAKPDWKVPWGQGPKVSIWEQHGSASWEGLFCRLRPKQHSVSGRTWSAAELFQECVKFSHHLVPPFVSLCSLCSCRKQKTLCVWRCKAAPNSFLQEGK